MSKKIVSSILIVAILNLVGCYSYEMISGTDYQKIEQDNPDEIIVKTFEQTEYYFAGSNFHFENDTLYGKASRNSDMENVDKVKIAISDIESIETKTYATANTWILGIGVGIVAVGILAYVLFINTDWASMN